MRDAASSKAEIVASTAVSGTMRRHSARHVEIDGERSLDLARQPLKLRYDPIASLPQLAWCARMTRGAGEVDVFHGRSHTSPMQRHFPFILNTPPIRQPWEFMFTFQWTLASVQGRYALHE